VKAGLTDSRLDYSGRELRSHWIMERFSIEGDAVVSFRGACMVTGEDLVDREDFLQGNIVAGDDMQHFIVEIFGAGLLAITFAQRLLCSIIREVLNSRLGRRVVERSGDDLFVGDGKLSVSVATVSPVSGLIHLALNVTTGGVPVKAACLSDLGIDPRWLAGEVASRLVDEVDSCIRASHKVRPVL
jgi:hypothetical protein